MKALLGMVVVVLAASCGSELESLKNEVCACKGDMQCLAKLEPKLMKAKEKMGERKPTAEEEKIATEMMQCMMGGMKEE